VTRWYSLPGWPVRVIGAAAAMPTITRPPGSASMYKNGVTGRPGTVSIPVSGPQVPTGPVAQAMGGSTYTANCPGYYPNQYYARWAGHYYPGAGMSIAIHSDNLMPVPATDPRGVAAPLQTPLSLRGVQDIRQPPALIQWPAVNQ
jgi:hypothetical protein